MIVPKGLISEAKMQDKKAVEGYVYHNIIRATKNGNLIFVSISAAPIFIQDQLIGYLCVYKDISEQTNAQKRLVAMNDKLLVVGGLTRHDVRNKLSAIVGNAYLEKKEMAGNDRALDYLAEIEKAVQQSVKILDFARTYEMLGAQEKAYIDVEKTFNGAASLFTDLSVRLL
jgi:sensor histidine kinase regulating citrate/malate metabolism